MMYEVITTARFEKEFKKLDRYTQCIIKSWVERNLVDCSNPRQHGKPLKANKSGQWRYCIGDYRLICEIYDDKLVILALSIGHRRSVYEN